MFMSIYVLMMYLPSCMYLLEQRSLLKVLPRNQRGSLLESQRLVQRLIQQESLLRSLRSYLQTFQRVYQQLSLQRMSRIFPHELLPTCLPACLLVCLLIRPPSFLPRSLLLVLPNPYPHPRFVHQMTSMTKRRKRKRKSISNLLILDRIIECSIHIMYMYNIKTYTRY